MTLPSLLMFAIGFLSFKVALVVVLNNRGYLPSKFESDYLTGRDAYSFGSLR